jgi:hypothetical protein
MRKLVPLLLTLCLLSSSALAYGPRGHKLVGAIADKRLAEHEAVAKKVRNLLDGLTLERVATLPDEIKSWDNCNPNKPGSTDPVVNRFRINKEMRAFFNANLCSSHPSHHEFHYTDVPVFAGERYGDGTFGREQFDIVQMIPFCIRVLEGKEPANNPRRITKTVAVILLAHYLGDIHQPLHVGAQYFKRVNGKGIPAVKGWADQGGNKLTLWLLVDDELKSTERSLHSFWDGPTVNKAFGSTDNAVVAERLATQEPDDWQLNGNPEKWAEQMADDILPLAKDAHDRLAFVNIKKFIQAKKEIERGDAQEKSNGGESYTDWSAGVVEKEIQKGGWRLAALLEKLLK